jgi:Ca-activated chloride channel family protein
LFWIVIAIPVAVYFFMLWSERKKLQALSKLGALATLTPLIDQSASRVKLKHALFVLALIFLLTAALRPQWGLRKEQVTRTGLDLVIALDVSASMFAEDLQPNRLTKSIMEIQKLLLQLSGDRVGLVTFSGSATAICPLTLDYNASDMFLRAMTNYREAVEGTNLVSAYQAAVPLFEMNSPQDKLLLIFTDGENHEGSLDSISSGSRDKNIIVIPVAVGSGGGQPVPNINADGTRQGYKKDKQGNVVISHVDVESLKKIATIGPYLLDSDDKTLSTLLDDLKRYKRGKLGETRISIHQERYQYFLLIGFLLLLASYMIKDRK